MSVTSNQFEQRYYDAKRIYGTTKLANLLMARELARRLKAHNVVSNAVHPGSVQTNLFRNIPFLGPIVYQERKVSHWLILRSAGQGSISSAASTEAASVCHLAVSP